MNQCECDDIISTENQHLDEVDNNMNNSAVTMNCVSNDPVMTVNEESEVKFEQNQTEVPQSTCENPESNEPVQQFTQKVNNHHVQAQNLGSDNMINNNEPPPLQPIHRSIPSNQANMGSTTSCMTGFQSTFSQEHVGLPDPHRPAHYTDPLPGSVPHQYQWQQQHQQQPHLYHQQQHPNQYINVNNNAAPENFHGYERPSYGLVHQVIEVFKISGKPEMQPSEIYYELEKQFPYYRFLAPQKRKSWMSSVRHALTNAQFKARRCAEDEGKPPGARRGHFWSIDENYVPGQENTPNRPSQSHRRRSKVMNSGGRCNYIKSPSGQLISEPLAGTSMMSPPITYTTAMGPNGVPVILPATQFNGQVQLLPAMTHGSPPYPKQDPGGNGQFLWIPPANSSPQQQPQVQQQQIPFNGTTQWGNSQIATYQPTFNGNMANNYNFSNNIQQHPQLQQQRQLQQQQQQQQQQAQVLHNAATFRYASPPIKQQTLHPQKYFTTSHRFNVVSNVASNSAEISHLQQQQHQAHVQQQQQEQQQQQQQIEQQHSSTTPQVSSCSAVVQAFAELARTTESLTSQPPDVGPGGDTTPTSQSSLNHEDLETVDNQTGTQESQTTTAQIAESQELQISSQNPDSQILKSTDESQGQSLPNPAAENPELTDANSSSEPSSAGHTRNGLFPVTLYTSSDEKNVLPSVETLAKDLAQHTGRNNEAEIKDDKSTIERKADLRAMVYSEVCNTGAEQEASTLLPSHTVMTNAATIDTSQPETVTLQVSQPLVDDASGHWSVQQVQY